MKCGMGGGGICVGGIAFGGGICVGTIAIGFAIPGCDDGEYGEFDDINPEWCPDVMVIVVAGVTFPPLFEIAVGGLEGGRLVG